MKKLSEFQSGPFHAEINEVLFLASVTLKIA